MGQMRGQQERTETSSRGHHRGAGRGQVGGTPEGIRPPYYIGYKRLHEIATKLSPLEAVLAVMDPNESFRRLLSNSETFQKSDRVVLIVGVFEKVCCVDGCENMVNAALTMLNQSEFLEVCSSRVLLEFQCNPSKTEVGCQLLQQFFLILKAFATKYPGVSGSNVMKAIHACNNYVLFLKTQEFDVEALEGKFAELLTTVQDASKAFQGSSVSPYAMKSMAEEERLNRLHLETAPNNFREIPIIPTSEEILNAEAPFLRSNITKGAYMNVEHYLDVQFRLLREDFVAPLRNGLKEYLLGGMGRKNFRHQDIRVYTGVTFHHMDHDFYGIHLIFKFDVSRFSRVKWDITKRFMTGSLLCFADLDFNYLTFGTVSRRNADELKKGFLTISPQSDMFNLDAWMQGEKIIIEASSAYFEAYRHVLRCLQQRDEESFPLTDYIVYGAMKDAPPKFLPDYYDFSFIRTHLDTVDLLAKAYWPPAGDFGLDESQLQAFQSALTQEFSVIQGPPGSGKTYIGLKVVETLLKNNVTEQTGPILVICFTNHALDQFLEGILSFTKKIVRIGGRSKSPHMEAYHIRKWEEKTRQMKSSFDDIVLAKMRRQHICEMNTVKGHVKYYQEKLSLLQEGLGLVSPQTMKDMGIMDEETHRVIPKFFDWLNEFGGETNFQRECRLVQDGIQRELIKLKSAVPLEKPVQKPEPRQQQEEADDDDDEEDEIEDAQAFRLAQFVDDDEFDPIVDVEDNKPIQVTDAFVKLDFEMFTENLRLKIQHAESKLEDFVNVEDPSPQEVAMMAAAEKQYTRARKELEFFEQIQPLLMVNPLKIPPKPKILQEGDLDEQTLLQLSLYECLELVAFWHGQVFAWIRDELMKKSRSYLELVDKLREVQGVTQLHAMKGAEVIGMTTSGAAKYQALLQNIGNKIVIVEEAAEVMEAHIVTSLSRSCQQLILIGDHQQLRPNPTVYELARKYHLDVSMFERAVNNGIQVKRLRIQHRMRPAISCLITPHIYPDLINHDSVLDYPSISGMSENLFFLTHAYKEAERLLRQDTYTTEDITILTTYSGQLLAFKQLLKGNQYEDCKGVRCTVVDNFQGEENKIILLSLVRSNEEAKIGFLKTENRVCVALSRAKWGLYIVGNMDSLCSGSEIWKKMLEALEKQEAIGTELELQCSIHRDQIISASQPSHFPAGGGCHLQCKVKMPCGHVCPKACHAYDREHKSLRCNESCLNKCPAGTHDCAKRCWENCNPCRIPIVKTIPACRHSNEMPCHLDPDKAQCQIPCVARLECGHQCARKCHVLDDPEHIKYDCQKPCERMCNEEHKCKANCGHGANVPCCDSRKMLDPEELMELCEAPCSKVLPGCEHEPCTWQCDKGCPKKLKCTKKCHEICNREPCDQPCPKKIKKCDHPCIGLCGEPCPPQCKICNAEELAEFQIYGNEADEDARFVYLPDCGHCIEVEAMDHHMKMEMEEIGMKKCPRCHTVIWSSVRYGNVIRQLYRNVAAVKEKAFGDPKKNQDDFLKSSQDLLRLSASSLHLQTEFTVLKGSAEVKVERIKKFRNTPHTPTIVDQFELLTFKHQVEFLEKLDLSVKQEGLSPNVQARLARRAKAFASRVLSRTRGFNDWELKSLAGEVVRLRLMGEYWKLQELGVEKHPRAKQHFQRAETLLLGLESFTEEMNQEAHKELDAASKSCGGLGISNEERIMILKAMNLGQGHWYKCPNGHIYAIGDCGGANQTSQCNECRAVIGGERHRLIADNAHASEMDGSRFPAWSEMNNLQNFDPRQVL
ncbi:unnamed protein product [Darwinula stevensoni]|uniref:RZ-type domain-containing protein n=1 Tax=Darwinula stevensoni TaxID=69355 RepID=A0A7R8ZZP3_9CRUS|nr:unnamed protein product [Darwinula stevensoni]CAG0882921.1 unnamed protein product [Darwinula stevensoni]